jgi:amidase
MVASGEASPLELVDEAIARIEDTNPAVNAVIHERFEAARAEAVGELPNGPFRGVPFLVKDLRCAVAGEPLHLGCQAMKDADVRADHDSFMYESIRGAGLITLGRTNTPEFGSTVTTEPTAFGATRNPWDTNRSAGGSSGGSAAAVAAGMVPMAHASDGGGSIRVPASECGIVGLKPSRGRVSLGPGAGESWAGASTDGAVSRTVRDTAAILDVMQGRRTGDPYVAPPPLRPFAAEVGVDPGQLRVGIAPTHESVDTHVDCVDAVQRAGTLLESLGHHVAVAHPPPMADPEFPHHFVTAVAASMAADFEKHAVTLGRELNEADVEADNWLMAALGQSIPASTYINSVSWLHSWSRRMHAWWDHFDVLVTPVIAVPPPPIGWLRDPELGTERLTSILQFTPQFNVTGQPGVSLPLHWTDDDLPIGVQFVGPIDDEALLIRLAAQIEAAAPWADRVPGIFG